MSTAEDVSAGRSYLRILRRRFAYIAIIAPLVTAFAVYLAFDLAPLYRSTATILLEPSPLNKDVVASTVSSYSKQQIEIIEGRVLTPDVLANLVSGYDPYPGDPSSPQKKAQRMLANTSVERVDPQNLKPDEDSNAFSLHYDNPDPQRAAQVASRLAQLFLTYNQHSRTAAAKDAATFLANQSADISRQLQLLDDRLKQFKAANNGELPDDVQRNESEIDLDQRQLESLDSEILTAEAKESSLSVQLSQMSPNMITQAGDLTDIATVRAQLAEAEQRYTPEHPEVIRLKKALAALAQKQASQNGIVANANNPQYILAANELQSARRDLNALRSQEARLRGQIDKYEEKLRLTPGVEREFDEITRRRSTLLTAYQQIQEKLQNARLAERFEVSDQGDRFMLIRAPYAPRSPVYPNRVGLILLGLLLGSTLAAIAVAVAESTDPTIRGPADLPTEADAPFLASIPLIPNSRDTARRRLALLSWVAAYGVLILVVGGKVAAALHGLRSP
jgi:protein tyrosine kinase modulator